jgi:hypothetical protein
MPPRIVRLEGNLWRIMPEHGEIDVVEEQELRDYFGEVGLPYQIEKGRACVLGSVGWEELYERLAHFYEGRAEVYPF